MKKFLYVLIITVFLILNNSAFAAYKPVTFMERDFHLKRTSFDKNYGMINIYTAFPGYEQDKYFDELYLSYDKFNYPVKNIYNDFIKHYSAMINTIKATETRVAVSSVDEENNYLFIIHG